LSKDPIEESGGLNLYGFVGNNGVNLIDILGNTGYSPYSVGHTTYQDGFFFQHHVQAQPFDFDIPASDIVDGALLKGLSLVMKSPFLSCYLVNVTEEDSLEMLAEIQQQLPYEEREFFGNWVLSMPGNWSAKFLGAAATAHNLSSRIPQGTGLVGSVAHKAAQKTRNATARLIRRQVYQKSVSIVGRNGVKYFGRIGSKLLPFVGLVSLGYEAAKACHCYSVTKDGDFVRGEEFLNFGN
jgi:hypothetical protein